MIHMIQRTLERIQLAATWFHWRVSLIMMCTTWLVLYQILTWHETRTRERQLDLHLAHVGAPPIMIITPAPVDAATRLAPALTHLDFADPAEYFQYVDARAGEVKWNHHMMQVIRTR